MKTLDERLLTEVTRRLVEAFDPEQVILFGSHAWGRPTDDSDVDLLVIVSESDVSPIRREQHACRSMGDILAPIDVLVKTRAEVDRFQNVYASLECQILEQGRILYDRGKKAARAVVAEQGAA